MRLSITTQAFLVITLFAIAISYTNTEVEARAAPGFGQRRLLNLSGNSVEPEEVPDSLAVAQGNKLHMVLRGDGVQEYTFENGDWTLYNASASLCTLAGKEVGQHYYLSLGGEPTWQTFAPESLVTGAASVKVQVSADSIPWILLNATKTAGSWSQFGDVTFVQRLYTEDGLPPGASYAATAGDRYRSPYRALYFFYKKG